MSFKEIADWQAGKDLDAHLALMVAMHAAPLLLGSKVANIITIPAGNFRDIVRLFQGTDISVHPLRSREGKVIVFLYRKKALREYLSRRACRKLLKELGYPMPDENDGGLAEIIRRLARRISFYHNGQIDYPHEIGLFLGYPVGDVRGFLKKGGRDCLYSGYWKVYTNVAYAKRLFARFENDRELAVAEVIRGRSICEIVV